MTYPTFTEYIKANYDIDSETDYNDIEFIYTVFETMGDEFGYRDGTAMFSGSTIMDEFQRLWDAYETELDRINYEGY